MPQECIAKPPAKAFINKCCRIGEYLEISDSLSGSSVCKIGGNEKWWPEIFLVAKKITHPVRGTAPNHMNAVEDSRPNCTNPETFTKNFYILSNGFLFLYERSLNIQPREYCAESDLVQVCFPESDNLLLPKKKSIARKCCGPRSIYDAANSKCISISPDHELSQKAIVKSPHVDIRVGFPDCEKPRYAIAGSFDEREFDDETGVLTFDSRKNLQSSQYCLEYTDDGSVQVFSCEDNFVATPVQPDVSKFLHILLFIIMRKLFYNGT